MRGSKVVQASLVAVAAILLSVPLHSADPSARIGSIEHAFGAQDGAAVLLDSLTVLQAPKQGYVLCRDPWVGSKILPLWASAKVEPGWSIEVTGRTETVSGKRIVVASRIRLYTDSRGEPFRHFPKSPQTPVRGWPWMKEIDLGTTALDSPGAPPEPDPLPDPPSPSEAQEYTVAYALRQPVGAQADVHYAVCTADSPTPGQPVECTLYDFALDGEGRRFFYIQDADWYDEYGNFHPRTSAGIRINWDSNTQVLLPIHRGDGVLVSGTIRVGETDGEKQIDAALVWPGSVQVLPAKPLGMNNRAIGGNTILPGEAGEAPGVKDPYGLYNKGLLIRTWGKVTCVDPQAVFCYIDDGSVMNGQWLNDGNTLGPGGTAVPGVRVVLAREGPGWKHDELPQVGQFVAVTGISSSTIINDQPVRMVRQMTNFGRVLSQTDATSGYYVYGSGRGLMTTDAGDTYFTVVETWPYYSLILSLWKYQPGLPPLQYSIGQQLGCLDVDVGGTTFWGGSYRLDIGRPPNASLYHYSLTPPFEQLDEIPISWLPPDLDGLAIAPDGTFWISGDLLTRVYHVDRNGQEIGHFDTAFPVSGHEYVNGHLWLASINQDAYCNTLYKVNPGNGQVVAYFVFDATSQRNFIEDLNWRASESRRLKGLDINRWITTWDLTGVEVIQP